MSHRVAFFIALAIIAIICADLIFNSGAELIRFGRMFLDLVEYLKIWK